MCGVRKAGTAESIQIFVQTAEACSSGCTTDSINHMIQQKPSRELLLTMILLLLGFFFLYQTASFERLWAEYLEKSEPISVQVVSFSSIESLTESHDSALLQMSYACDGRPLNVGALSFKRTRETDRSLAAALGLGITMFLSDSPGKRHHRSWDIRCNTCSSLCVFQVKDCCFCSAGTRACRLLHPQLNYGTISTTGTYASFKFHPCVVSRWSFAPVINDLSLFFPSSVFSQGFIPISTSTAGPVLTFLL